MQWCANTWDDCVTSPSSLRSIFCYSFQPGDHAQSLHSSLPIYAGRTQEKQRQLVDGASSQWSACAAFGLRSRSAVAFATPLQPGQLLLLEHGDQRMIRTVFLTPSSLPRPFSFPSASRPGSAKASAVLAGTQTSLGSAAVVTSLTASRDGRLIAAATTRGMFLMGQHAAAGAVQLSSSAALAVAFATAGQRLLAARGTSTECWDVSAVAAAARLLCPDG